MPLYEEILPFKGAILIGCASLLETAPTHTLSTRPIFYNMCVSVLLVVLASTMKAPHHPQEVTVLTVAMLTALLRRIKWRRK